MKSKFNKPDTVYPHGSLREQPEMDRDLEKAIILLEKAFLKAKEPLATEIYDFITSVKRKTYHKSQKEDWNVYISERSKAATDFADSIHLCHIDWNNDNEKWKYLAEHPDGLGQLYSATINTFTAGAEWQRNSSQTNSIDK